MALDSIGSGLPFYGHTSQGWTHPVHALNALVPQTGGLQPLYSSLGIWPESVGPKVRRSVSRPQRDRVSGWGARRTGYEGLRHNTGVVHQRTSPFNCTTPEQSRAADVTHTIMTSDRSPWQPMIREPVVDGAMVTSASNVGKNSISGCFDVNVAYSIRERSQSTGSWRSLGQTRVSSEGHVMRGLAGSGFDGRMCASETPVEMIRGDFVNLWSHNGVDASRDHLWKSSIDENAPSFSEHRPSAAGCGPVHSQPGQEPLLFKDRLKMVRQRCDDLPVDMTCRKRKYGVMTSPYEEISAATMSSGRSREDSIAIEDDDKRGMVSEPSILRSMLTERARCHSMSVIEMRRRKLTDRVRKEPDGAHSSGTASATAAHGPSPPPERQWVTLAKKNLLPVAARISDLLGRIVEFARARPQFALLSKVDQEDLLRGSCLRLLLLTMAETNLQFATTTVAADPGSEAEGEGQGLTGDDDAGSSRRQEASQPATVQFVDSVQNFIRKCQLLNITSEEYVHMKLITLFRAGIGSVECNELTSRINSAARQDLQDLVSRSHPDERLRYSLLLLSLHTLFGVHCGMMQALFCAHLDRTGGIRGFLADALSSAATAPKENSDKASPE